MNNGLRCAGNFDAWRVAGNFMGGDFNGDRRDDIAESYDYGIMTSNHTWLSTGSGLTPMATWWSEYN